MNIRHGGDGSSAAWALATGALTRSIARLSTSRLNSRLGLVFDVTVAIALLGGGLRGRHALVGGVLIFAAGLVVFTFVEYVFHRWLFHGTVPAFAQGHDRHHEQPLGHDALPFFLPPLAMLALAGVLHTVLPASDALLFAAALATGYALYGLSHSLIHARRFRNPLARRWAASHHVHHYHPDSNFGVTTPFWDIAFRTRHVSGKRGTP